MPSRWQRLHVSSSGNVPTLLYQFTFTVDGYELYITDLTYMWSEHLDRKSILRRADEDDTTIDPSEDNDQFTVLLQKIEEALHHDSGHSAALSRGSEGANLHLFTTTKLPAPLNPLRWRFYLSQNPHSTTTDHLLLPLVKSEAVWQSREQVLIDQLMKKDWVLGKLFDKLEALGIDIGTVFPGVSGHRPGQKDTMLSHTAKYIKGVEPFDKDSWIRETNVSFPELSSAANLATEATGSGVGAADRVRNLTAPADGWWKQLSTAVVDSSSDNEPRKPAVEKRQFDGGLETDTDSGNEDDDDDDFERQETPPHLRRTTAKTSSPSPGAEPSSTGHGTRSPSRSEHLTVRKTTKGGGLGVIGGRKRLQSKEKTPPSSASEVDIPERRAKPSIPPSRATDSDATASETDGDDDLSSPPPPKPKAPAPVKRGLGIIGGKKKEQPPSLPSSSNRQPSQPPSDQLFESKTQTPPKRPGRLGVIGGVARSTKRTAESQPPTNAASSAKLEHSDDAPEGATAELADPRAALSVSQEQKPELTLPAEQEKEESEQQRADRKRDELKRQLEAKAKAPAKKKRKF